MAALQIAHPRYSPRYPPPPPKCTVNPPPPNTAPWGYHLWIHLCPHSPAQLSHRISHAQTVNDNSVRAFYIPYTQFLPLALPTCDVTHSLSLLLPQQRRLLTHPPPRMFLGGKNVALPCFLFLSCLPKISACFTGLLRTMSLKSMRKHHTLFFLTSNYIHSSAAQNIIARNIEWIFLN